MREESRTKCSTPILSKMLSLCEWTAVDGGKVYPMPINGDTGKSLSPGDRYDQRFSGLFLENRVEVPPIDEKVGKTITRAARFVTYGDNIGLLSIHMTQINLPCLQRKYRCRNIYANYNKLQNLRFLPSMPYIWFQFPARFFSQNTSRSWSSFQR